MKGSTTSICTPPSHAPSACAARCGLGSVRSAPVALALSLLLHAALFAAAASLATGGLRRAAGDEIEAVPGVAFAFVTPEPPAPAEPAPVVEAPPAPPLPIVTEPAAPVVEELLVTIAAPAPVAMPTPRLRPAARHSSTMPPKPRRTTATGTSRANGVRGGDAALVPAVCTYRASPDFPATARREGRAGSVVVLVSVDSRGRVGSARVLTSSGHTELDAAAQNAARRCRFRPATCAGAPVASEVRVPYTFRINR